MYYDNYYYVHICILEATNMHAMVPFPTQLAMTIKVTIFNCICSIAIDSHEINNYYYNSSVMHNVMQGAQRGK